MVGDVLRSSSERIQQSDYARIASHARQAKLIIYLKTICWIYNKKGQEFQKIDPNPNTLPDGEGIAIRAVNLRSELLNCHALQRVDLKSLPPKKGLLSPRIYKTVG